jgi:hypothetical protein
MRIHKIKKLRQIKNTALFLLFGIIVFSCSKRRNSQEDPILAKVYDNNLYSSQLTGIIPEGISDQDSLLVVKDHIDKWVRNQLLLHLADMNLDESEKDVEQQIDDYRTSLLIFKYEQNYIKEKLDTLIPDLEIEEYYNSYSSNFLLNTNLVKGRYIKIGRSAPDLWRVRKWSKSDDEEDIKKLETYCYENSAEYSYFEEEWMIFNKVLQDMPKIYMKPETLLSNRKSYEAWDTNYCHFLKISDYRLESSVAPLDYIKNDIKSILLNKRKLQLIQELEANVYNDALNRGNFSIY